MTVVISDAELEELWRKLEDIPFSEDSDGTMRLEKDWFIFDADTELDEIWHWFDDHHSKGVGWLMENVT